MSTSCKDEYLNSPLPSEHSAHSPTYLWAPTPVRKQPFYKRTFYGVPFICWVTLCLGVLMVVVGSTALLLLNGNVGHPVIYLRSTVDSHADYTQCSTALCMHLENCKVGPGERIKVFVGPLTEVREEDGTSLPAPSTEFLAVRRAFLNQADLVELDQACLIVPGVDFMNLMRYHTQETTQRVIEAVHKEYQSSPGSMLLVNNVGLSGPLHMKAIWASASLDAHSFRPNFDVPIPALRPYQLHYTRKEEKQVFWTVHLRFASSKTIREMERIMNVARPKTQQIVFATEIPEDRYNMSFVADRKSNQLLDYADLLQKSSFVILNDLVPGFQLAMVDVLQSGSIPVIIADDFVAPFSQDVEWKRFAIVIPRQQSNNVVTILNQFPEQRLIEMRMLGKLVYEEFMANPEKIVAGILRTMKRRFSNEVTDDLDLFNKSRNELRIWRDVPIRSTAQKVVVVLSASHLRTGFDLIQHTQKLSQLFGSKLESILVLWPEDRRPSDLDNYELPENLHFLSVNGKLMLENFEDFIQAIKARADTKSDAWLFIEPKKPIALSSTILEQTFQIWRENADQLITFDPSISEKTKFARPKDVPFYLGATFAHPYVIRDIMKDTKNLVCSSSEVKDTTCAGTPCPTLAIQFCRAREN